MKLKMLNDSILVKEEYLDITVNGISVSCDSDAPYMFCSVVDLSSESKEKLNIDKGYYIVIKRYAKEEFISGLFFVSWKDVRCSFTKEEYEELMLKGISI